MVQNKRKHWFIILGIFIILITILSGCKSTSPFTKNEQNINLRSPKTSEVEHVKHKFSGAKPTGDRINFLVVGVDSRGEKNSRSDAIMIVQLNKKSNDVRILSIMRDSYVYIPTYKHKYNKINVAYFLGGPDLLRQTIYENFKIKISHYVTVDFKGFVKLVDLLAPKGIAVTVKEEMLQDTGLNLPPGVHRLNGEQLLAYSRFRHDALSDFGRVARQQEIITSLKDEFFSQISSFDGIVRVPSLINEAMSLVDTDMGLQDVIAYGSSIVLNPIRNVETLRIPITDGYTNARFNHAGMVLQLDEKANLEAVREFMIDKPTPVNK